MKEINNWGLKKEFSKEFKDFIKSIEYFFNENFNEKNLFKVGLEASLILSGDSAALYLKKKNKQKTLTFTFFHDLVGEKKIPYTKDGKLKNINLDNWPKVKPIIIDETDWTTPPYFGKTPDEISKFDFLSHEKKYIFKKNFYLSDKTQATELYLKKLKEISEKFL